MSRTPRALVAGIGNVFLGDDGFGVEVVRRLRELPPVEGIEVRDFGIRGLDLAYALLDGYDAVVFVDVAAQGGAPGTLYVIEPDEASPLPPDMHRVTLAAVLGLVRTLGECPPVRVVGCEPATLEPGEGLSPPVQAAVGPGVELVRRVVGQMLPAKGDA